MTSKTLSPQQEAGLEVQVERTALERAVASAPGLGDAGYKLALLQSQAGEYQLAVKQLRLMRVPAAEGDMRIGWR